MHLWKTRTPPGSERLPRFRDLPGTPVSHLHRAPQFPARSVRKLRKRRNSVLLRSQPSADSRSVSSDRVWTSYSSAFILGSSFTCCSFSLESFIIVLGTIYILLFPPNNPILLNMYTSLFFAFIFG